MYEDFKKTQEKYDSLKSLVWQCVVKENDLFSVDLLLDKENKNLVLMHVGKNGYDNENFYIQDFSSEMLFESEIDDFADKMVYDLTTEEKEVLIS